MKTEDILMQKDWTEQELADAGFKYYTRKKHVVLARELPIEEAPLKMKYNHDELIATVGYFICFSANWQKRKSLYDYYHWPVAPDHFADLYIELDDPNW